MVSKTPDGGLPRTLCNLRLVGQHGGYSVKFVDEDRGIGPRDLAQCPEPCHSIGVEMNFTPLVAPRWFLQPMDLEEAFEQHPRSLAQVGQQQILIVFLAKFKSEMKLQDFDDDRNRLISRAPVKSPPTDSRASSTST